MYNIKPTFLLPQLIVLVLLGAGALVPIALAADQDAETAIRIEANALEVDEKRQISTFSGQVRLVRGALTILSDRLELREFDNRRQEGIASGKPAQFERLGDPAEGGKGPAGAESIRGSAERITYDNQQETLLLEGQAVLQRWRNGKLRDETTGPRITYAEGTGLFTVDGGTEAANKPKRVTATISPQKADNKGQ